jgi:cephalosporin hydroxylase
MNEYQADKLNKITGWFSVEEMNTLIPYVYQLPENALLVEIGTYHGKSTLFWRFINPNIRILTNDICSQEGLGTQENQTTIGTVIPDRIDPEVLEEGNIFQVRGSSHDVVKTFNWDIDLLFIDSEHSYKDTIDTLNGWGKFVKKHHYIICHDYTPQFQGVIDAVEEYVEDHHCRLVHKSSIAIIQVV